MSLPRIGKCCRDYFDLAPEEDLLDDPAPADALLPDVADWLLPLPLPPLPALLPELLEVPVSSSLLLPPFLPPCVGLLIIVSWVGSCGFLT
jgi:hypothetical protein